MRYDEQVRKLLIIGIVSLLAGCSTPPATEHKEGTGHVVLKPLSTSPAPKTRQLVYVPAYSAIYWGFDEQLAELAVTLSIRNVARDPIVIHSAKYFDSDGKEVREFVATPSELGPMATADFVIQRRDTSGGPGANFLVEWSSTADVDEPVIEAVMVGQHGNAGVSFVGLGRALPKASAKLPTR
ncbi:MAG: DUF3124 domain-containing protein [Bryobacteraceae bacterium]